MKIRFSTTDSATHMRITLDGYNSNGMEIRDCVFFGPFFKWRLRLALMLLTRRGRIIESTMASVSDG